MQRADEPGGDAGAGFPDDLARRLSGWATFSAASPAEAAALAAPWLPPMDRPELPVPPLYAAYAERLSGRVLLDVGPKRRRRPSVPYDPALCYVMLRALYDPRFELTVEQAGRQLHATHIPGHPLGPARSLAVGGPGATSAPSGPATRRRALIVGKMPGRADAQNRLHFTSENMWMFHEALDAAGVDAAEEDDYYLSSLVRFDPGPDATSGALPSAWAQAGAALLRYELALLEPDYVLCLGADALKALCGPKVGLASVRGRYEPLAYLGYARDGATLEPRSAQVTAIVHPTYVELHRPELRTEVFDYVARFAAAVRGDDAAAAAAGADRPRVHAVVTDPAQLARAVDRVLALPDDPLVIAWDAEWRGQHPSDPDSRLLSVQFSATPGTACCVAFVGDDGLGCFLGGPAAAARELRRLLAAGAAGHGRRVRHGGHFFNGDVLWIRTHLGLDLGPLVRVPDDLPDPAAVPGCAGPDADDPTKPPVPRGPWDRAAAGEGGFDTGLAIKAVFEAWTATETNLKDAANRFCRYPSGYDRALDAALRRDRDETLRRARAARAQARAAGAGDVDADADADAVAGELAEATAAVAALDRRGFDPVPRAVLWPYACHDADAGRSLYDPFFLGDPAAGRPPLLSRDSFGLNSWPMYWSYMASGLVFREMEELGIGLDLEAVDALNAGFTAALKRELDEVRRRAAWPDFAPGSVRQKVELLFGDGYNRGADGTPTGRLRPPGARCLGFAPLKATTKFAGREWSALKPHEQERAAPSTDAATLAVLAQQCAERPDAEEALAIVQGLQRITAASKMISNLFGPRPEPGPDGRVPTRRLAGGREIPDYAAGLGAFVAGDGRVHSRFYPAETGRANSSGPNLMNLGQRKEWLYQTLLGDGYRPVRSCVVPRPGHVLVSADYSGAELAMIAWVADDPSMIEAVRRNSLPSDHPDYRDIHSNGAVEAFGLDCAPTKAGLKAAGQGHLRDAYKTVVFGIPYGRGDAAIALECRVGGNPITVDQAAAMRAAYFAAWPRTRDLLEECADRVLDPGWIACTGGGLRRFFPTRDKATLRSDQRSAGNFPIQGGVAFAMRRAMHNAFRYREEHGVPGSDDRWYDVVLQIHDALDFEVPIPALPWFLDEVLFRVMVDDVPVAPVRLDGRLVDAGLPPERRRTYHFGLDYHVYFAWNVAPTEAQCLAAGVDPARVPNLAEPEAA